MYYNSIDITTFDGYILRIDCNKAEEGLKTTAWTDHVLNAMAIDNPLEYARLYSSFFITESSKTNALTLSGFVKWSKADVTLCARRNKNFFQLQDVSFRKR